jgi:hypothetical protein
MLEIVIGMILIVAAASLYVGYSVGYRAGARMVIRNSNILDEVVKEIKKERGNKK